MEHGAHHSSGGHAHSGPMLSSEEFLKSHPPGPPSYLSHDSQDPSWPSLMIIHVVTLSIAFFILLPMAISLRSVKHRWHASVWGAFHIMLVPGLFSATLYNKVTPNLYEGSKHSGMGYAAITLVAGLWVVDCFAFLRRAVSLVRDPPKRLSFAEIRRAVFVTGVDRDSMVNESEYTGLVQHDNDEEVQEVILEAPSATTDQTASRPTVPPVRIPPSHGRSVSFSIGEDLESGATEHWVQRHNSPYGSPASNNSDLTLHETGMTPTTPTFKFRKQHSFSRKSVPPVTLQARLARAGNVLFHVVEQALVPLAFATSADGLVVYAGICRGDQINTCLAHLIKGGIFWCFGLLSFARYLGAWKKLGWAWNRASVPSAPSAEFVECLVIFIYGATNTWMERFSAHKGDPYTTKQIQHISIAVMFWFAGLIGMALESRRIRRWLSGPSSDSSHDQTSLNPMPALVIGVTGIAMAAHHQATQFLVQIHVLWGTLLAAFSVMRWFTYFLLWVKHRAGRTTSSEEPSRPPTEVLASFFLSAGGLVFILSMESIGIEAMRAGHDDMMMFLNFAVSVTCLGFTWMFAVMAFNGYIKGQAAAEEDLDPIPLARSPRRSESL